MKKVVFNAAIIRDFIHDSRLIIHVDYSLLKLFTGFAIAAFIACRLTVIKAIAIIVKNGSTKNIHFISMRNA
ncbi:MAG: hypothetical protein ABJB05_05575 [Parafilimonas sp.]